MDKKSFAIILVLSVTGVTTHLLPHVYGFTTVGALSMLAAAYLPRHLIPVPVIVTVLASDLILGGYALIAMVIVYFAHVAAALGICRLIKLQKISGLAAGSIANAVIFYLISNLAPMASGYYPPTFEGLLLCYTMALPFLAKGIAANLIYGSLAFGAIYLMQQMQLKRRSTSC